MLPRVSRSRDKESQQSSEREEGEKGGERNSRYHRESKSRDLSDGEAIGRGKDTNDR